MYINTLLILFCRSLCWASWVTQKCSAALFRAVLCRLRLYLLWFICQINVPEINVFIWKRAFKLGMFFCLFFSVCLKYFILLSRDWFLFCLCSSDKTEPVGEMFSTLLQNCFPLTYIVSSCGFYMECFSVWVGRAVGMRAKEGQGDAGSCTARWAFLAAWDAATSCATQLTPQWFYGVTKGRIQVQG